MTERIVSNRRVKLEKVQLASGHWEQFSNRHCMFNWNVTEPEPYYGQRFSRQVPKFSAQVSPERTREFAHQLSKLKTNWTRICNELQEGVVFSEPIQVWDQVKQIIETSEGEYPTKQIDELLKSAKASADGFLKDRIAEVSFTYQPEHEDVKDPEKFKLFIQKWEQLERDLFDLIDKFCERDRELMQRFQELVDLWPKAVKIEMARASGNILENLQDQLESAKINEIIPLSQQSKWVHMFEVRQQKIQRLLDNFFSN